LHTPVPYPTVLYSCHIGDNVSFKFGGMDKHTVCLFVCLFNCFVLLLSVYKFFYFIAMLLIGHDLHHNCGLHVIGVFNLFEH
jgi:hypothetical protein